MDALNRAKRYRELAAGCCRLADIDLSSGVRNHFLQMAEHGNARASVRSPTGRASRPFGFADSCAFCTADRKPESEAGADRIGTARRVAPANAPAPCNDQLILQVNELADRFAETYALLQRDVIARSI